MRLGCQTQEREERPNFAPSQLACRCLKSTEEVWSHRDRMKGR